MDSGRFSRVVIVDSIPQGELNTARNLRDDLRISVAAYSPTPGLEYIRAETPGELVHVLQTLREDVRSGGAVPALHIECHGDADGFLLADGTFVEWALLKAPLTELNIATELHLFITVAACVGGALAKVTRLGDRAPYWGLIGPTKIMMPQELEVSFRALYSKFFETKSAADSVRALEASAMPGVYWRTTAQGIFEKAWRHYKATHGTPEALQMRAEARKQTLEGTPWAHLTVAELVQRFQAAEPILWRRYFETFFMCDLYPSHRDRFNPASLENL